MLLLLLTTGLLALCSARGASHRELSGEEPDQSDIDSGVCIPIKCNNGPPPMECTSQCAKRKYVPICKPPGDFCLCQRLVNGKVELVSPDEVDEQPAEAEVHSYFFAIFVPIKNFLYDSEDSTPPPTAESIQNGFDVNVHEGRLFWDFRYILTGLFLLMVGLVAYEVVMCRQARKPDDDPKVKMMTI